MSRTDKEYEYLCDCLEIFVTEQNYKSHCRDISGRKRGCHETFASKELLAEHYHPVSRGCRWPGNIEDYYRKDNIWYKKEPKPEEDTQEASRNSSYSRSAAKPTTSNGSRERTSHAARQRGQSLE